MRQHGFPVKGSATSSPAASPMSSLELLELLSITSKTVLAVEMQCSEG
jgi:hypothetical protein